MRVGGLVGKHCFFFFDKRANIVFDMDTIPYALMILLEMIKPYLGWSDFGQGTRICMHVNIYTGTDIGIMTI